jgi:glutathione S-transferase
VYRIACAEKGVPYALVPARPHTPDVDSVHPLSKIPVLRHGALTLCESRAICFYIDHAFAGKPLVPREPAAEARVEQWISIVNTAMDPVMVRQYLGAHFFPGTPDGSPDRARIEEALPKMATQLAVLDRADAPTGHLAGEDFTLADISLLPILYYLGKFPQSAAMLAGNVALAAYCARHLACRSVEGTLPPPLPGRGCPPCSSVGGRRRVVELAAQREEDAVGQTLDLVHPHHLGIEGAEEVGRHLERGRAAVRHAGRLDRSQVGMSDRQTMNAIGFQPLTQLIRRADRFRLAVPWVRAHRSLHRQGSSQCR